MVSRKFLETILRTPSGIRTLDPLIKSQLLYQLSEVPGGFEPPCTVLQTAD